MEFSHVPVLLKETIEAMNLKPDGVYIDGTAGGGGHSSKIARQLSTGRLLAIDQDPAAIKAATKRLADYKCARVVSGNFGNMLLIARENEIQLADGILLDIGVSSHQLDEGERGFSYHMDAPLDMRMSGKGQTAADIVNKLSWQELAEIISLYGEDKSAARIAKGIVRAREAEPIKTTAQLADIVRQSVPAAVRRGEGHPARKTFQALRIAVNGELDRLKEGLEAAFELLKPGGRLAVISFHSLEDRIVKQQMNTWCEGCICPKEFPVCVCKKEPKGRILYKRGLVAGEQELAQNPRARSARLRVFEKA